MTMVCGGGGRLCLLEPVFCKVLSGMSLNVAVEEEVGLGSPVPTPAKISKPHHPGPCFPGTGKKP